MELEAVPARLGRITEDQEHQVPARGVAAQPEALVRKMARMVGKAHSMTFGPTAKAEWLPGPVAVAVAAALVMAAITTAETAVTVEASVAVVEHQVTPEWTAMTD